MESEEKALYACEEKSVIVATLTGGLCWSSEGSQEDQRKWVAKWWPGAVEVVSEAEVRRAANARYERYFRRGGTEQ